MRPRRARKSGRLVVKASTAITSLATVMSTAVSRVMPRSVAAVPVTMPRRKRSFTSSTRRQVMVAGSMSSRMNLHAHEYASHPVVEGILAWAGAPAQRPAPR